MPSSRAGLAVRRIARLLSLGALYAVSSLIRSGGLPGAEGHTADLLSTFFLLVGVVGLGIGWMWEGAGGMTAVASMVVVYVVVLLDTGSRAAAWAPSIVGGCGFLFILSRAITVVATHDTRHRSQGL